MSDGASSKFNYERDFIPLFPWEFAGQENSREFGQNQRIRSSRPLAGGWPHLSLLYLINFKDGNF
jgi:hypothetical protein